MEDKWINIPRGLTPVLTPVSWHIRSGQEEESDLHTFSSPPHLLLHLPRLKIVLPGLSWHLRPDRGGSDQYVLWWLYLLEVTWLLWKCWLLKCQIRSDAVTWLLRRSGLQIMSTSSILPTISREKVAFPTKISCKYCCNCSQCSQRKRFHCDWKVAGARGVFWLAGKNRSRLLNPDDSGNLLCGAWRGLTSNFT